MEEVYFPDGIIKNKIFRKALNRQFMHKKKRKGNKN